MEKRGKKRAVTLKDISEATGYSINTISHALWNKPDIAPATRKLIRQKADELGYVGNSIASSLRSGKTKTVAIIVGDISNPHFAVMAKEIEETMRTNGYSVFLLNTDEDEENERQCILLAMAKSVDGIIICPSQHSFAPIELLQSAGVPFVLIGRHFVHQQGISSVVNDDVQAGYLAAKHILERGHRNVLFLNGPAYISSSSERLEGVCKAYREAGVSQKLLIHTHCSALRGGTREPLLHNLREHPEITAVLGFSDLLAWEVLTTLQELKISVPEQMGVAGFDNLQSRLVLPISLTSVSASKITMARTAAELLCRHIDDPSLQPEQIVLDVELIDRESV